MTEHEHAVGQEAEDEVLRRRHPNLTLLFFGAAKDVVGSNKNGHRRESVPTFRNASERPSIILLSGRAMTPEEVRHQGNHRYY
jgi:hypothetical protein